MLGGSESFGLCFQMWRPFCNQFEGLVEDFNYGTLLRLDCEKDYTEENTIFGKHLTHDVFTQVQVSTTRTSLQTES